MKFDEIVSLDNPNDPDGDSSVAVRRNYISATRDLYLSEKAITAVAPCILMVTFNDPTSEIEDGFDQDVTAYRDGWDHLIPNVVIDQKRFSVNAVSVRCGDKEYYVTGDATKIADLLGWTI